MKVHPELLDEILKDPSWNKLIRFKEDKTIWIDLEAYSDGKYYLPIGKGYDSYTKGYLFTQKLYEDKYRTKDNLLELEYDLPKYHPRWKKVITPIFNSKVSYIGSTALSENTPEQEFKTEYLCEWVKEE